MESRQRPQRPPGLRQRIVAEIAARGPLRFDAYMARALYDPDGGYYCGAEARAGRAGDFVTSPALAGIFGRVLAGLVGLAWRAAGRPEAMRVIDAGAGEGHLLASLLPAARSRWPDVRLEPVLVERGAARRRAAAAATTGPPPVALADTAELAELPPSPGLVLANELFDALPVRRLRRRGRTIEEVFVEVADERLVGRWRPAEDGGVGWLPREREVCVAVGVEALVEELTAGISRGLLLIVDYGYPACILRAADGPGSSLRGFERGTMAEELVDRPGEVDLTAHVDFSAVDAAARARGLERLLFSDQSNLLLALDFLDDPAAAAGRRLIHPEDMGGAFKCLLLGREVVDGGRPQLRARDRSELLEVPTDSLASGMARARRSGG